MSLAFELPSQPTRGSDFEELRWVDDRISDQVAQNTRSVSSTGMAEQKTILVDSACEAVGRRSMARHPKWLG